jgi:TatD DNase family protein
LFIQDTFDIINQEKDNRLRGVLHCYSGSEEMAREYIKLGFYISFGGPVTFKNSKVSKKVAQDIPLDKMLIETDSPYLTPEPNRGKRNEPMFVKYTALEIAKLREITVEQLAEATSRNAKALFNIE